MTAIKRGTRGRRSPSDPLPYPGSIDATRYANEWNKPKTAIFVDKKPTVDLVEIAQEQDFYQWVQRTLSPYPRFIRQRLTARVNGVHAKQGRHIAAMRLKGIIQRELPIIDKVIARYSLKEISYKNPHNGATETAKPFYAGAKHLFERFNHLPDYSRIDVDLLAQDIAMRIGAELAIIADECADESLEEFGRCAYSAAAVITELFRIAPPCRERFNRNRATIAEISSSISKMVNESFWKRRLRKYAARWREHLHIAFGDARRDAAPYCSKHCFEEWDARRKRNREILSQFELEDEETGERISLIDQIDKSISNPEKRRTELMTRISGFDKAAEAAGFVGEFFTLTSPSKYHAYTVFGPRNPKWQVNNPRDTQTYLNKIWQRIRASLARQGIETFGLRVAEPHHDGTPHWHGALYVLPENMETLRQVLARYAYKEDAHELSSKAARRARFFTEQVDREKGGVAGYLAKYISKNINGYALDNESDTETGKPLKLTALHATAWASCWGIRQFQFIGGAPVSVWRELRRMRDQATADKIDHIFADIHRAADDGDWFTYTMLQGGPTVSREALIVRTYYQEKEEPNEHGEYTSSIKGVYMQRRSDIPLIETHTRRFRIVRINSQRTPDTDQVVDLDFSLERGASAPPRTRVNNCTQDKKQPQNHAMQPPRSPGGTAINDCASSSGEPEQLEFGKLSIAQRAKLRESLRNYRPIKDSNPLLRIGDVVVQLADSWSEIPIKGIRKEGETAEEATMRWRKDLETECLNSAANYYRADQGTEQPTTRKGKAPKRENVSPESIKSYAASINWNLSQDAIRRLAHGHRVEIEGQFYQATPGGNISRCSPNYRSFKRGVLERVNKLRARPRSQ